MFELPRICNSDVNEFLESVFINSFIFGAFFITCSSSGLFESNILKVLFSNFSSLSLDS